MKILKSTAEVPHQITYRGHIYKSGVSTYGNLENARRDKRYFMANNENLRMIIRKYYMQPSRPYPIYVLYRREV